MFMPLALAMMTGCSTAAIVNKGHRYFRTGNRGLLVEKIDDIEAEMMMDSETDDGLVRLGRRYVLLMFTPLALAMVANSSTTTATFNKTLARFGTGVGALWTNRLLLNGEKRRYISYTSLHDRDFDPM
ncbi:hypothetical protein Goshw_027390 [Gossypium schwendimanii]|uniref:Uncharacterized protein n=1 Tax=Gossypium schwendimanii TaxID=34291 RepID=A0A7J9MG22_GOSSC|nr:hypothetical protein [Gossypium schwendimanii]